MKVTPWIALCACAAIVGLAGCKADTSGLATLTVGELAARLQAELPPVLCDANSDKTRRKAGVIPGARLLSSYRDYDPALELPGDNERELVFYCHSEMCGAAADAARKAVAAGHRRVWVMPAGIRGWTRAGRPIESVPPSDDA